MAGTFTPRALNVLCLIKFNVFSSSVGLIKNKNPSRWDDVSDHIVIINRIRLLESRVWDRIPLTSKLMVLMLSI